MSQSAFQPLGGKEIRLITFEKDSNPPAFSLRHCKLRRASGRNICLSYCWGVAVSPHSVLRNGKELRVHANLYNALIQLARRRDAPDYWIDAICINQTDSDEKGSQIQLMGQILERAASVLVWLGTTSETENRDILYLPNLESPLQLLLEKKGRGVETRDLVDRGLPPLDSLFWGTLGNILNRPWFRRLWVIQEITLCPSSFVLLGKHKFVENVAINANLTVAETYQSFAIASLLADRRLSLLHFVSSTRAVEDLPSWCPDLSRLPAHINFEASARFQELSIAWGLLC